jgi:enoyl-[acyl-carrier protein] reductase II
VLYPQFQNLPGNSFTIFFLFTLKLNSTFVLRNVLLIVPIRPNMNRINQLLGTKHPIIQAGMVWCSGWELATAVSIAGGLGVIGSGSMHPEVLNQHINKCKEAGVTNFAVNIPLLYPQIEDHIRTIIQQSVPVVISSAGNPNKWTKTLQAEGIKVLHVVSSAKFALKSQDAGVDAVIAEGFEAGGHNGREETTTLCLIPEVVEKLEIPVVAAGGISDGKSMLATMVLGAEGVQVGSRFVASIESSAHVHFKNAVIEAKAGETELSLKTLTPVRLLKNHFHTLIRNATQNGASEDELRMILGKGRAKKGMFEGNMTEGELEIGQISSRLTEILPAATIIDQFIREYESIGGRKLGSYFDF